MARKYSNVSKVMTLTASVTITDVQIHVDDASGLPNSFPYVIVIDYEQPGVEICLVTAAAGNILTVDRGQEDTAAQPHTLGAVIVHAATAQDLQQAADHVEATTNVHGIGAGNAVVGTGTTQTLTNKTMSGSDNSFSNIPGSAVVGPINGTVTVAQVIGDWPIDTRSTGSLNISTRTIGNLAGSRLASPVTNNMTFDFSIFVANAITMGIAGTTTTESLFRVNRQFGANGLNSTISIDDTQALQIRHIRDGGERAKLRLGTDQVIYLTPGAIAIGASGQTFQPSIDMYRLVGADQYVSRTTIDSVGNLTIDMRKNGTLVNMLRLAPDGNKFIELTGQPARYIPWAQSITQITASISNNSIGSFAVTFPAGRFTVTPRILCTSQHWDWPAAVTVPSASGATIVTRHSDLLNQTLSFFIDVMAMQMTAAAASGLAAQQEEDLGRQETVTCHNEGCENADAEIVLRVTDEAIPVICGPCGQPITDRVPV